MELHINKKHRFCIASSFVLLAILFGSPSSFGQMPKLLLKFAEKQQKMESGYVKLQRTYIDDDGTQNIRTEEAFFISTQKNFAYLAYHQRDYQEYSFYTTYCKLAHTIGMLFTDKNSNDAEYLYDDIYDAKDHPEVSFSTDYSFSLSEWENSVFQRIPPKINPKNIRYKIVRPNSEFDSNRSEELEFERKTFNLVQEEYSGIYYNTDKYYKRVDILEQHTYDYIHPDISDTIHFKYEELKKGYDRQCVVEQTKRDSVYRDSIAGLMARNAGAWVEDTQKDTVFFMPEWKFPSLSGDTLYSANIKSRFLLIDLWYMSCHPCRLVMRDLASIDTLYDESLLKMVSINILDTDTAKMNQVVKSLNLQSEVVCGAFNQSAVLEMAKKMGESRRGYPQLYLIDMKTKQVIWYSYGWHEGFTKEIETLIR